MDTASNESKRNDEPAPVDLLLRPQSGGPGPRIREARETAGLSVGEFATQLRLTVATLVALEGDDFQTLREPVYVRGYYRKVAKLLPLKEQDLIAAYDRVAVPRAAVAATPSKLLLASSESEGRDPRSLMRWLLAAVLVITALLVVGLLFSRHERAATAAVTGETPAAGSQEPPPGAAEGATPKPAGAAPNTAAPATGPNAQPSSGTAATPAPQPMAPAQPEPAHPAPTASDTGSGLAPASPAAESGSATLVLDFHEQSWAEVFDASGKRLLSGMMRAGAHEMLAGRPPYSVFLGNAPKVDVSFSGQHVDLGGRVRDNATARFQIPLN
jgi:cytoskeleton protein RodZ